MAKIREYSEDLEQFWKETNKAITNKTLDETLKIILHALYKRANIMMSYSEPIANNTVENTAWLIKNLFKIRRK